jgi:adhesin/invasin
LFDANGNRSPAGDTVVFDPTAGTISATTDNGDGSYTATLTSSTVVETSVVSYFVNGVKSRATVAVDFVPGEASAGASKIVASPTNITADGVSISEITVTLFDVNGNRLSAGGDDVIVERTSQYQAGQSEMQLSQAALTAASQGMKRYVSGGSLLTAQNETDRLSAVIDNNDGTYSATLTSSISLGASSLTFEVNSQKAPASATVKYVPGEAAAPTSAIEASPDSIVADGVTKSTITVTLFDALGHRVETGGDRVGFNHTAGALSNVTDNGDGTYSATLTSSRQDETSVITFSVNSVQSDVGARVRFVAIPGLPKTGGESLSLPWILSVMLTLGGFGALVLTGRHKRRDSLRAASGLR